MDPARIRCACIDIGSNTTRLLVADVAGGRVEEVLARREFTRLGSALRRTGALPDAAIERVASMVAEQRAEAEAAGAEKLRVVATAAIRAARNRADLRVRVQAAAGVSVDVLGSDDEARLAFAGALASRNARLEGEIAVVDVGGLSSEIAIGTAAGGVAWSASLPVGSGFLADAYLRGDPPGAGELRAVREHAAGAFDGLDLPAPAHALAVGGSAASMCRLVGPRLDGAAADVGLRTLSSAPCAELARRHDLDPVRVRLLPAGLMILAEASDRLGRPLELGCGGLREGVCLDLAG